MSEQESPRFDGATYERAKNMLEGPTPSLDARIAEIKNRELRAKQIQQLSTQEEQVSKAEANKILGEYFGGEKLQDTIQKISEVSQKGIETGAEKAKNLIGKISERVQSLLGKIKTGEGKTEGQRGEKADNQGYKSIPPTNEEVSTKIAEEQQKEQILNNLKGTKIQLGEKVADLDIGKVILEKKAGLDTYELKSTQTGFECIQPPGIEVKPNGNIVIPNNTITLKGVPFIARLAGISDGIYKTTMEGKVLKAIKA